ncbi:beta propeller repeat protein [Aeromonas veronii]|uniref:sialidase family protein n=1 Tax=Aeromonas veronii TaxID=654 RepID=UPI00191F3835|nr:sialidase family protein [Aeromonas veronii]MBL0487685.1 exo-alpha-sialidase [Aeromonas veronii]
MSALEPVILNEVKLTQKAVADLSKDGGDLFPPIGFCATLPDNPEKKYVIDGKVFVRSGVLTELSEDTPSQLPFAVVDVNALGKSTAVPESGTFNFIASDGVTAVAVGNNNKAYLFKGGAWSKLTLPFPSDASLYRAAVSGPNIIISSNTALNIVAVSTDGGATFQAKPFSSTAMQARGCQIRDDAWYLCAASGNFFKTVDQGDNWQKINIGTSNFLTSVSGEGDLIVVSGFSGTLRITEDGGATWRGVAGVSPNENIDTMYADGTGLVVHNVASSNGYIRVSRDFGASFPTLLQPSGHPAALAAFSYDRSKGVLTIVNGSNYWESFDLLSLSSAITINDITGTTVTERVGMFWAVVSTLKIRTATPAIGIKTYTPNLYMRIK